jgi:hypothetical protein
MPYWDLSLEAFRSEQPNLLLHAPHFTGGLHFRLLRVNRFTIKMAYPEIGSFRFMHEML